MYGDKGDIPDGEYTVPLGKGQIVREGTDVTIVSWSKILARVAAPAVDKLASEGISAELIDPRTLRPMDWDLIVGSVKKTNRLVVVEEGWPFNGVGAQISHEITLRAFDSLDAPVVRVTQEDVPLPYAHNLEKASLPSVEKVVAAVQNVMYKA
jgi:pyruvate dehydrogenase E1 component beta subunit